MSSNAPSGLGLRHVRLLEGLPAQRLEAIAQECAWRNYASGRQIISRNAADRDVYFLVSGRVRVTTYSAAGRQVTFSDYGPGEFFGDVAAIDDMPRTADVVALESSLLASLSAPAFRRLLRAEPVLAERLLKRWAGLVRRLSERVIDLSTLGVHSRIHAEVLKLAQQAGVTGNSARIEPGAGDPRAFVPDQGRRARQGRPRAHRARREAAREAGRGSQAGRLGLSYFPPEA
jgi:CRP/FNR family cyclic AMP-dependent transcriptional regulator